MILALCLLVTAFEETPSLVVRKAQPYVAIRQTVTMKEMASVPQGLHREVAEWLKSKGVQPAGAPLIRFVVVDMDKGLQLEVGWPVAKPLQGSGRILSLSVPAGKYARLLHRGNFSGLVAPNAALQEWVKKKGHRIDQKETKAGLAYAGRYEFYITDPGEQPDPSKWETEILYKIASP